ncbi:hypothetical protein BDZ91DRAFT_768045 [Kalaharituber pfeilii]|nr:hypothetical protein BDZ91DRAFT_768045 [Kalaharituber pfeilii]
MSNIGAHLFLAIRLKMELDGAVSSWDFGVGSLVPQRRSTIGSAKLRGGDACYSEPTINCSLPSCAAVMRCVEQAKNSGCKCCWGGRGRKSWEKLRGLGTETVGDAAYTYRDVTWYKIDARPRYLGALSGTLEIWGCPFLTSKSSEKLGLFEKEDVAWVGSWMRAQGKKKWERPAFCLCGRGDGGRGDRDLWEGADYQTRGWDEYFEGAATFISWLQRVAVLLTLAPSIRARRT